MSTHPERRGPRIVLAILLAVAALAVLLGDAFLNGLEAAYERSLR